MVRPSIVGGRGGRPLVPALFAISFAVSFAVSTALTLCASASFAADPTSASFSLRGLHPASVGPVRLAPAAPSERFSSSGASLGQGEALGPAGIDGGSLQANLPGFWSRVAGAVPSLDGDADGLARFLDPDDDEDGLVDTDEYSFGTNSLLADTDGDGVIDGVEVALGSNPLDPLDPAPALVPSLSVAFLGLGAALMLGTALRSLRIRLERI